jgi:hypothetical protein
VENHVVENAEFKFLYKEKIPVQVHQEAKMFVRECVASGEDGFCVQLERI